MKDTDWKGLRTAVGDAGSVPAAIDALFSGSESEQHSGYLGLDNHVVLQGDLYPAAPFVAREIIRRLAAGIRAARPAPIYRLLEELRLGYAPPSQRVDLGDGRVGTLPELCASVIDAALPVFLRDAQSGDDEVRRAALSLLEALSTRRLEVMDELVAAAGRATDADIREDLESSVAELRGQRPA